MSTPPPLACRLMVRGRVQGVFFRDWTVATVRAAGLAGWVRNRLDGAVEIHVEGAAEIVGQFVRACHEGPPAARVEAVEVAEVAVTSMAGFERRATG